MATVTIINENGGMVEKEVSSERGELHLENGDIFKPAVVERVEYDHKGAMSQIHHQNCHKTENRREGNLRPNITMEGIVIVEQLETLKDLHEQDELTLISDLYRGEVTIRRVSVEQNTDIIHFTPNGDETQLAFTFQLQLKEGVAPLASSNIDPSDTAAGFVSEAIAENQ